MKLSDLSKQERLAYPGVQRGVRQRLSMADIGAAIRRGGVRIANAPLRELVRAERAIVEYGYQISGRRGQQRIDYTRLPPSLTKLQSAYSFTVELSGTGPSGEKVPNRFVTVSTNRKLRAGEILDAALKSVAVGPSGEGFQAWDAQISFGQQAGALGVL